MWGVVSSEHVERRGLAMVERDIPVLDADRAAAVDRRVVFADVAGGEDPGHRGLELGAAAHAAPLADLQAGALGEMHVGR